MNPYRVLLALAWLGGWLATAQEKAKAPSDVERLQAGAAAFACDLYRELRATEGNLALSPFAVFTAGAMLATGADGRTAEELYRAFHLPERQALLGGWPKLRRRIAKAAGKGVVVRFANAACVERSRQVLPAYQATLKQAFRVPLYPMDFVNDAGGCVRTINAWAARMTENEGMDLLAPADVTQFTALILVNASYFKGKWEEPFARDSTRNRVFHLDAAREVEVPTMYRRTEQRVADRGWLTVVPLDYRGGPIQMVLLVPRAVDGIARIEEELSADTLAEWLAIDDGWRDVRLRLYLPRFAATCHFDLMPTLGRLGVSAVMDQGKADLTPIFGAAALASIERPALARFIHAAGIRADEEGTVAWSKTAVGIDWGGALPEDLTIRVNRPFLFLVREPRTGLILYMGRVMDPR